MKILQRGFTIVSFDDTLNISDYIFTGEKLKVLVFQKIISAMFGPFVKLCTCTVQRKAHTLKGLCHEMNICFWRLVIINKYFLIVLNFFVYLLMKNRTQTFSLLR